MTGMKRNRPYEHRAHGRRCPIGVLPAAAMALVVLWATTEVRAEAWIRTDGSAVIRDSETEAQARAEEDALTRGLAGYLLNWFSEGELERQMPLLSRHLFADAAIFVEAVSDVTRSRRGSRVYWRGRVRYTQPLVEATLERIGLLSPWAREPFFVYRLGSTGEADNPSAVVETLRGRLAAVGLRLVPEGSATDNATPDGHWQLDLHSRTGPDPIHPGRVLTVTTATIRGDVAGSTFEADLPVQAELSPPDDLALTLMVDRVLALWVPHYRTRLAEARWELGPLSFDGPAEWLEFDRRILAERSIFHDVHPIYLARRGPRWEVRYGFFLAEGSAETANAWLLNSGLAVERQGERRFVPRSP